MKLNQEILLKFISFKKIWGIQIIETPDNEVRINGCLLAKEKSFVKIVSTHKFQSLKELTEIASDIPLSISLESPKILHKTISTFENYSIKDIIHNVDPNLFSYEKVNLGNKYLFSIIRLTEYNNLLNNISELNLSIIAISLGPVNLVSGKQLFKNKTINLNSFTLYTDDNLNINITNNKFNDNISDELLIGTDHVSTSFIVPYFNAFTHIINKHIPPYFIHHSSSLFYNEFKYKQLFKKSLVFTLVFCLILLLANFIIYQNAFKQHNAIIEEYVKNQKTITTLENVKSEYENKMAIIESLNYESTNNISFYSDKIAQTLPNDIILTKMIIYPPIQIKEGLNYELKFKKNEIKIEGECISPKSLNNWLNKLCALSFIKELTEQNYKYDNFEEKAFFNFSIILN